MARRRKRNRIDWVKETPEVQLALVQAALDYAVREGLLDTALRDADGELQLLDEGTNDSN